MKQSTYWRGSCMEFIFRTDRDNSSALSLIPCHVCSK